MKTLRGLWIALPMILITICGAIGLIYGRPSLSELPAPLPSPQPPEPEGILYIARMENGMWKQYLLDLSTSEMTPALSGTNLYWSDVSPDHKQVVYSAFPGLYIYNIADGSSQQITFEERDSHAQWSPDGKSIIYVNNRNYFSALYRYDLESAEVQQLTDYQNDLEPDWSPDGHRIVFTTSRDGFQELYTMKPDGTDLQRLTNNVNLNDLRAKYSPDGKYIAYMTNYSVGDGTGEIWLMNADGSNQRQITDNDYDDRSPIWSPDSRYITFIGATGKQKNAIYLYDVESDALEQITNPFLPSRQAVWSPDGKWLAFVLYSLDGQESQIYVMMPDGSNMRPVTDAYRDYDVSLWMPASLP